MKAVVTGGAGFIGAATVKCLLEKGHEVWAVVRPDSPRLSNLWHQVPEELRPGLQVISLDVQALGPPLTCRYPVRADSISVSFLYPFIKVLHKDQLQV